MSPLSCRLLPFHVADGVWNMAADDALLESAALHGMASLRFYGWTEPTLTLGYFQAAAAARTSDELASLPLVRRPSGGAALVHHHELTYALALPAGAAWQPPGEPLLPALHRHLQTALARLGVATRLCDVERKFGEVLCFLHHTPGDLLLGACKVVGSAQRKRRGAVLQHGGILLAQSPHTPLLPGIGELTRRPLPSLDLQAAIVAGLGEANGWRIEADDWSEAERRTLAARQANRYGDAAWNARR